MTISAASLPIVNVETDKTEYLVGDTITAKISIDPVGTRVAVFNLNLSYEVSKLEFITIRKGSTFEANLTENIDTRNGKIYLSMGKFGGLTERATLGEIIFKITRADNSILDASNSTLIDSSGNNLPANINNVSFSAFVPPQTTKKEVRVTSKSSSTSFYPKINATKSTVSFSKLLCRADGADKITINVSVKSDNGEVVSGIKPEFSAIGDLDFSDLRTGGNNYLVEATTKVAGIKLIRVLAQGVMLKEQSVVFYLPTIIEVQEKQNNPNLNEKLSNLTAKVKVKNSLFSNHLEIEGRGTPRMQFTLYLYPQEYSSKITIDDSGNWRKTINKNLKSGKYRLEATVTDDYGNESVAKVLNEFDVKSSPLAIYFSILITVAFVIFISIKIRRSVFEKQETSLKDTPQIDRDFTS